MQFFFVPLISIVALCCNCMMNVSPLARFLMDHQQMYVLCNVLKEGGSSFCTPFVPFFYVGRLTVL